MGAAKAHTRTRKKSKKSLHIEYREKYTCKEHRVLEQKECTEGETGGGKITEMLQKLTYVF